MSVKRAGETWMAQEVHKIVDSVAKFVMKTAEKHQRTESAIIIKISRILNSGDVGRVISRIKIQRQSEIVSPVKRKTLSDLCKLADNVDNLRIGYIGNIESGDDNRCWYIWVTNMDQENGNSKNIWSCSSKNFDEIAYLKAEYAVRLFALGIESYKKSIGEA